MSVQAVPSVPRASGRTRQWYAQIDTGSGPIRGTGTGTRASWIEIDGFDIVRIRDRLEPAVVTVRLTKRPDLATAHIYRASVVGTPLDMRIEMVDGGRTAVTATLRRARIIHLLVLPNGMEQFDVVAPKMEWKLH